MNETENSNESTGASAEPTIGRNEPCPCGSGKKYKRCCGVSAAPKLSAPKASAFGGMPGIGSPGAGAGGAPGMAGGMPPGMDQLDPQMMMQFSQMLSRLPKGQMQKLQGIMQRAMSGKDVTREAAALEATLPVEMQEMLRGMQAMGGGMPGMPGLGMPDQTMDMPMLDGPTSAPTVDALGGMSEEEARRIVEEAAKTGEISAEQATEVLADTGKAKGSFWKKVTGKK